MGSRALGLKVKTMEDRKSLESTVEESHGIEEATCMHSMVRNWRDLPLQGESHKAGTYKP